MLSFTKMKIKLEGPYSLLWSWAGLYEQPSGRWVVMMSNSRKNKTTISYAKYLMTIKLNRLLTDNEVVAHNNEDVTDDSNDNLVLTTKSEVSAKTNKRCIVSRGIEGISYGQTRQGSFSRMQQ